jgi:hypothetical protein
MIRALAEDSNAHQPLGPGEQRIEDERFVLFLGTRNHPAWTVAQRLRLQPESVEATVAEVRELVRERGRTSLSWEVSSSATPPDLVDRLRALGMVPDREPHALALVLTREPPPALPGIEVRHAESHSDRLTHARIGSAAFGDGADPPATGRATEHKAHYLASLNGDPVGAASAVFTEWAAIMHGGATLPHARGRGVYRALVRARWDDAVARGTPALVSQAGAMSRPILTRIGFEQVGEIHLLLDEFGTK